MKKYLAPVRETSSSRLIVLVAFFLITTGNRTFFSHVIDAYPVSFRNIAFLGSLVLVFGSIPVLVLSLLCYKRTAKAVIITILLLSSCAAYFMDSYNVIIDSDMIQNVVRTNVAESRDLVSFKMMLYVVLLGIIPSVVVQRTRIVFRGRVQELISRSKLVIPALAVAVLAMLLFGSYYASFLREHKPLRYYANPGGYLYAAVKYVHASLKGGAHVVRAVGLDARIPPSDTERELVIFVLGETARADRFSLNGYARETNPLLKKEAVISYANCWSCATSTAVSVPCMFSVYKESGYTAEKARTTENLLDVLTHAGVNVLWLDNNSDSRGVAARVPYKDYKTRANNPVCDVECRDEGMLFDVQKYIDEHPKGDMFIVLHQMGNHGPAYYKRYPKKFEKFAPACGTNQLEACSKEEIDNAYDNAILYTDYFLSRVIGLLKKNSAQFEAALFYISDHGESLGENGVYLHGMPNFVAPDAQRRVPAIMWFGNNFNDIDVRALIKNRNRKYSHDNVVHTVLGFMEIETSLYEKKLDMMQAVR